MKDLSFEAPNSPEIFKEEWQPQMDLKLQTKSAELDKDVYEAVLLITVTVKMGDKTAFLVEVQQARYFYVGWF